MNRRTFFAALALVASVAAGALAAVPAAAPTKNVLIIGDSITEYAADVQEIVGPQIAVSRKENSRFTQYFLDHFAEDWLNAGVKYDVIHWNHGLWDVNRENNPGGIAAYERNLREIIRRIREYQPQAQLIFATTTPVPDRLGKNQQPRKNEDVKAYNAVARLVMAEHEITVNDLYSLVRPRQLELQNRHDVHFCAKGQKVLAEAVAGLVRAQLTDGNCR